MVCRRSTGFSNERSTPSNILESRLISAKRKKCVRIFSFGTAFVTTSSEWRVGLHVYEADDVHDVIAARPTACKELKKCVRPRFDPLHVQPGARPRRHRSLPQRLVPLPAR